MDDLSEFKRKIYEMNSDDIKEISNFEEHLKNYEKIAKKDRINFNELSDDDIIKNIKNYLPEDSEDEINYFNPIKSHFYEFLKKNK